LEPRKNQVVEQQPCAWIEVELNTVDAFIGRESEGVVNVGVDENGDFVGGEHQGCEK